jgi:enoyl-CoA hydratase
MSYEYYLLEKKPPIAWIYLNRPDKKNAMNPPAWKELIPIMQEIDQDPDIRVSIIAGKGEIFCAGIDLITMVGELPEIMDKDQKGAVKLKLIKKIYSLQDGLTCIDKSTKPVIAAVHGKCIGAGLDMITCCDIRLCTEDAEFSLREVAVGFVADVGVLQRIPHIVGQGITRELAYTAKNISSKKAKDIFLVNEIFKDRDELMAGAEKMALEIAANSPLAVQATKHVLNYGIGKSIDENLKYVAAISANIIPSNDLMEAFTAFSQKRKPNFTGK